MTPYPITDLGLRMVGLALVCMAIETLRSAVRRYRDHLKTLDNPGDGSGEGEGGFVVHERSTK